MSEKMMPPRIQIELPESVADGTYANMVIITHSPSEFIFDFIRGVPGVSKAKVQTRVIMTPFNAKQLLRALQENIEKFEVQFGEIKIDNTKSGKIGFSTDE